MPGCPQWDPRVPGITGFPARTLHSVRMRLSATGGLPGALGRRGWNRAVPGQPPEAHPPGPVLGLHGTGGRPPRGDHRHRAGSDPGVRSWRPSTQAP